MKIMNFILLESDLKVLVLLATKVTKSRLRLMLMNSLRIVTKVGDIDGDIVNIYYENLPDGATFSTTHPLQETPDDSWCNGDPNCLEVLNDPNSSFYEAKINWTPTYEQAGQYKIYIHAVDEHGNDDWVMYIINVANRNRPPML